MNKRSYIEMFYKDSEGRIVIWQKPNLPIIIWLASLLLTKLTQGKLYELFDLISFGALFTWAFLEIFHGANYFRHILGFSVLAVALYSRIY